jgi:ribosomal-protein-alanine N-acetyltransferase
MNDLILAMDFEHVAEMIQIEQQQHAFPWPDADIERAICHPYKTHVCLRDQQVIGFAVYQWLAGEVTLMNIAVDPKFTRQGVASQLLNYAVTKAKSDNNIEHFFLEVRVSNQAAIKLYEQQGFVEIARRQNYYPAANNQREDAVIMQLTITEPQTL